MSAPRVELPPVGTTVYVIRPVDSDDDGWIAVPRSFSLHDLPEGYEVVKSGSSLVYGEITSHEFLNERSQAGKRPIVVEQHMYLEFHPEYWR